MDVKPFKIKFNFHYHKGFFTILDENGKSLLTCPVYYNYLVRGVLNVKHSKKGFHNIGMAAERGQEECCIYTQIIDTVDFRIEKEFYDLGATVA